MGELPQLNCNKEVRKSRGRGALTVIDNGRDRVLKYHKSDKYAFYTVTKVTFFQLKKCSTYHSEKKNPWYFDFQLYFSVCFWPVKLSVLCEITSGTIVLLGRYICPLLTTYNTYVPAGFKKSYVKIKILKKL